MRRVTSLGNKQIGSYFGISDSAVGKADKATGVMLKEDRKLKKMADEIFSEFRV